MNKIIEYFKKSSAWITLLIIACASSNWLYSGVYVYSYSLAPLAIILIGLLLFFEFLALILLGEKSKENVFIFVVLVVFFYIIYGGVRTKLGDTIYISYFGKTFIAILTVAISLFITSNINNELISRLKKAVAIAGVIYLTTPLIYSYINSKPVSLDFSKVSRPTMILILDEFSDTAGGNVASGVKKSGYSVNEISISTAGLNTLDVIPRLFLNEDFSEAQPCSSTAICSKGNVLDFSKIHIAGSTNISIVGFHHPYCSIIGLVDCYRGVSPAYDNSVIGFGCYWMGRLGFSLKYCGEQALSPAIVNKQRVTMLEEIHNASFWNEGGLIYIHIMLPHPPGVFDNTSLDSAYSENIVHATLTVIELVEKLNNSFPNGFQLYVTSDHPLRPNVWCGTQRYAGRCEVRESFISTKVPLISISNFDADICLINSNFQIFECVGNNAGGVKVKHSS